MKNSLVVALGVLLLWGCQDPQEQQREPLPFLGQDSYFLLEDGTMDTVFHVIPSFSFLNQDSTEVTRASFDDHIYVADFFFTTCPTICPIMSSQMKRVQDLTQDLDHFRLLSHTVDPHKDTIPVLKAYAKKLNADLSNWDFVWGIADTIYNIGFTGYLSNAGQDDAAPGGFLHSAYFTLVDKNKRVRGVYDGTKTEEVNQLIEDIKFLHHEQFD